jgi:hypothetical protein
MATWSGTMALTPKTQRKEPLWPQQLPPNELSFDKLNTLTDVSGHQF